MNYDIQWRLARVTHDKAKYEKDKHKRQNLMLEAFSYAEKALELNSNSAHSHRVCSTPQLRWFNNRNSSLERNFLISLYNGNLIIRIVWEWELGLFELQTWV